MRTLNVGLVGLGRMGMLHFKNCLHIKGVNIIGAADASKKNLSRAKRVGIRNLYNDYSDLLKHSSNLDSVIVTLPNFLHFESIMMALEAGLNVFTEKPMASTVDECTRILKMTHDSGRKLMIGHNFRFVEAIEKMKEHSRKGEIGDLETVTIEEIINGPFSHPAVPVPVSEWWFDPKKSGGGALLDIGYHLIDLFRFFVGDSEVMFCSLDHKFNLPIEDGAILVLRCTNSTTKGILNIGWWQKTVFPRFNFRLILHGNAGYISSDELIPKNLYVHAAKEGTKNLFRRIFRKDIRPLSYTYFYESYYKELKHFFNCINNDREPDISADDGLKTIEIIESAYKKSIKSLR